MFPRDVEAEAEERKRGIHDRQDDLSLLGKKGWLATTRCGNRFQYEPKRSLLEALHNAADSSLLETRCENHASVLIHLTRNAYLHREDIATVHAALDAYSRKRNLGTGTN
jgi:predicted transcriptional regulator